MTKEFDTFQEAFDYVREADKPVRVLIERVCWKLFPSGYASFQATHAAPPGSACPHSRDACPLDEQKCADCYFQPPTPPASDLAEPPDYLDEARFHKTQASTPDSDLRRHLWHNG